MIARTFLRDFAHAFMRNEVLDLAAQVAYFAILALFPFAMFVLTLLGYIPLHGLDRQLVDGVHHVAPPDVASLVETTLSQITGHQRGWLLVSTLVFALWSASGGVHGVATALNRAYDVPETRPIWALRLRALVLTLFGVVAAIVATVAMLVGPELVHRTLSLVGFRSDFARLWGSLRWPVAALAMISMVALVYLYLPNVQPRRRSILPGAIVAVVGWIVASFGFRLYVAHLGSYARLYGALGTVVALLLWLYLSGLALIIGGQVNATLDRLRHRFGHTAKPPSVAESQPQRCH